MLLCQNVRRDYEHKLIGDQGRSFALNIGAAKNYWDRKRGTFSENGVLFQKMGFVAFLYDNLKILG